MLMYDWFHIFLNGGLLDVEVGQCFKALKVAGKSTAYADLLVFASEWTWPRSVGNFRNRLASILGKKKVAKYHGTKSARPHF